MGGQPATEATGPLWLVVVVGASLFLPLLVMTLRSRRMFRWTKKETKMPDQETTGVDLGEAQPLPTVPPEHRPDHEIDDEQTARWAAEGIPQDPDTAIQEVPIETTPHDRPWSGSPGRAFAAASVPAPIVQTSRVTCVHCDGRGFVPGINDLLQESIALIDDSAEVVRRSLLGNSGDEMVRLFYVALLGNDPDLASLFPDDLLAKQTVGAGPKQRDRLLKALTALAQLYDPADSEKMAHLDQALQSFGRSHAAFVRKDGTIKGATWEEYAAVKDALFTTLIRVAADAWRPEYSEAWSQAYDYAAGVMLVEQFRSGFAAPRFPRA